MSDDDKNRETTERRSSEKKEALRKKTERNPERSDSGGKSAKRGKGNGLYRKILCFCAFSVLSGIAVFAGVYMKSGSHSAGSSDDARAFGDTEEVRQSRESEEEIPAEDSSSSGGRYCTQEEYDVERSETTIKEYGESVGSELLYFDLYDAVDHIHYVYRERETGEVLAVRDEMRDTVCRYSLYVVQPGIDLDFLESFRFLCFNEKIVNGVTVYWGIGNFGSGYARWEYKGFEYYLVVETSADEELIFGLISGLNISESE